MRALWPGLFLVVLAFTGCTDEPGSDPGPITPGPGQKYGEVLDADDPLSDYTWNGTNLIYDELEAPPRPAVGTAWTYAADGVWSFLDERTVVVVEDDVDLVFAASSQDELVNAAVWGQYWIGPMDAGLNPREADTGLFDWPLHDGKVFPLHGLMMSVVAELVETPAGTLPGYRISGQDAAIAVSYTYVPALGYLTSYSFGTADGSEVWERLELRSVGTADQAFTFERGPHFMVDTRENPLGSGPNATLVPVEIPTGYDEMVFVGLGTQGAEAQARAVDPVQGGGWGFKDAGGFWDWQVGRVSATPGTWVLAVHKGTDGWAYFEGLPVRWVTHSVTV